MKRLIMKPCDFECPVRECPPGYFLYQDMVGFKSEYGSDAYCDTGEYFCVQDAKVIPLTYEWEEA